MSNKRFTVVMLMLFLQTFLEQESGGSYSYNKKGPSMVEKIKKAIDFMRNKHHEVIPKQ